MKKLFILLIFFIPSLAFSQISGNAFWKYNDYVGNRPDAGSNVYLFSLDSTNGLIKTKTDINGNFLFKGLKDGDYFLIFVSENVTQSFDSKAADLVLNKEFLERISMFDYSGVGEELELYQTSYINVIRAEFDLDDFERSAEKNKKKIIKQKKKELELMRSDQNSLTRKILDNLKLSSDLDLSLIGIDIRSLNKTYFKEIKIKGGECDPIVIDFGVTYL